MYGLADNEFMLFKSQRSAWSKAQRQECDRKNTEAKTVVKSMENRQGDKICSFVISHGMAPERLLINSVLMLSNNFCLMLEKFTRLRVFIEISFLEFFHRSFNIGKIRSESLPSTACQHLT